VGDLDDSAVVVADPEGAASLALDDEESDVDDEPEPLDADDFDDDVDDERLSVL
jgi:hypothetical protein